MQLQLEYSGVKTDIYSVVLPNGQSPARVFLEDLQRRDIGSHKTMVRRYEYHANYGPTRVKQQGHKINGYGSLAVLKTHQGDRLLYFEHTQRRTILLIGYRKGDPARREHKRAATLRNDLLKMEEGNV